MASRLRFTEAHALNCRLAHFRPSRLCAWAWWRQKDAGTRSVQPRYRVHLNCCWSPKFDLVLATAVLAARLQLEHEDRLGADLQCDNLRTMAQIAGCRMRKLLNVESAGCTETESRDRPMGRTREARIAVGLRDAGIDGATRSRADATAWLLPIHQFSERTPSCLMK